ncbi:MAG: DinB family protein [Planctomycetota bacterium]
MIDVTDLKAEPVAILLSHCRSADQDLLTAFQGLHDEQLDQQFEMGPGSIRATYTHNLGALRGWADVYAERPSRAWLGDEGPFSIDQLTQLTGELHEDWARIAGRFPLATVIQRERAGSIRRFTRAHILVHVTTHSMHHRAQIINMLRHVGVGDLPTGSVMNWVDREAFGPSTGR